MIAIDTDEIIDYDFESKLCMECAITKHELGEESYEFSIWYSGHQDQCTQSHTGSSGSMECSIAKKIWERSKEYNIQYKQMICDVNSKAYDMEAFGTHMDVARTVINGKILTSVQKDTRHGSSLMNVKDGKKVMTVVKLSVVESRN